jgi:hypothetical protein
MCSLRPSLSELDSLIYNSPDDHRAKMKNNLDNRGGEVGKGLQESLSAISSNLQAGNDKKWRQKERKGELRKGRKINRPMVRRE